VTLLEWARTWGRRGAAVETAPAAAPPPKRPSPRIGAQYMGLYTYLENRYASNVVLTFQQMESLMGFALPAQASTEREWWTSAVVDADRHSDAWSAARRTAIPNLPARTVSFEREP
jgi:hypothetical protein